MELLVDRLGDVDIRSYAKRTQLRRNIRSVSDRHEVIVVSNAASDNERFAGCDPHAVIDSIETLEIVPLCIQSRAENFVDRPIDRKTRLSRAGVLAAAHEDAHDPVAIETPDVTIEVPNYSRGRVQVASNDLACGFLREPLSRNRGAREVGVQIRRVDFDGSVSQDHVLGLWNGETIPNAPNGVDHFLDLCFNVLGESAQGPRLPNHAMEEPDRVLHALLDGGELSQREGTGGSVRALIEHIEEGDHVLQILLNEVL